MRTTKIIQVIIQISTLITFTALLIMGRIQLWIVLFIASLLLSLFFSRFYCGWFCPIRTIQRPITYIKKKLKLKQRSGPSFLKNNLTRSIMLLLFIVLMLIVFLTRRPLPVLPALLIIGVIVSLVFSESLWHRWLCPYGTLLSFPSGLLGKRLQIRQKDCISCGICERTCPADAVDKYKKMSEKKSETKMKNEIEYQINRRECLVCLECQRQCPVQVIEYHQAKPEK